MVLSNVFILKRKEGKDNIYVTKLNMFKETIYLFLYIIFNILQTVWAQIRLNCSANQYLTSAKTLTKSDMPEFRQFITE